MNVLLIIRKASETVLSVFKKFLKKELGEQRYQKYCLSYEKYKINRSSKNRMESSQEIYQDLYDFLKDQDFLTLHTRMEKLIDSMCEAVNISKHFMLAFLFYIGGSLFLIIQQIEPEIMIGSLLLMSVLFIYKTCEFVVNKYCYIDANIMLVYKSVLDHLLQKYDKIK
ncbi:MAG: hypothetical protein ACERKN_13945 [Velocimicrobium sp.]